MQVLRQRVEPVRLSVRVNDDAGAGCMELARNRSVSRLSANAFEPDWSDHWATTIVFAWEAAK